MFNYDLTKKQIGALTRVIVNLDDEYIKEHPEDAKLLLKLQETLIKICTTIKSDGSM